MDLVKNQIVFNGERSIGMIPLEKLYVTLTFEPDF